MSDKQITFTSSDTGLNSFKFVLDASENGGKTIFSPSECATLKLYPGGSSPELFATCGSVKNSLTNLTETYTEYIAFRDSDTANSKFHITKLLSAVWEGTGSGVAKIYGSKLILPSATTGVLKIRYETSYDLINVRCEQPTYVLVTAKSEELSGDYLVDFTEDFITETYQKDVILTVRDACSREVLDNASVYINGIFSGKSDSEGLVKLGSMKSGTYNLKITKDGYLDTDLDTIKNDSFTVE